MADEATKAAEVVEAKPAKPAKKEKEPKVERPKLTKQNGVTRPGGTGKTGQVWDIADAISKEIGGPAPRKAVMEKGVALGINPATIATQYGRWRRFYGMAKAPKAEAAAAPAEAKPSDTTVEEAPKA